MKTIKHAGQGQINFAEGGLVGNIFGGQGSWADTRETREKLADEIVTAVNEHAALVAVAEAATMLERVATKMLAGGFNEKMRLMHTEIGKAAEQTRLALAAVRSGKAVAQPPKLDNYTREVVAAQFGYRCCEQGLNPDTMMQKLRDFRSGKA